MKPYLIDTNIVIYYLYKDVRSKYIDTHFNPFKISTSPVISIVTEGEIQSIALQRRWGINKLDDLEDLLNRLVIIDINAEDILEAYAEIDAYSQNKLSSKPLGHTPRNMGKNDLWIAATAYALGLSLLTSDKDFHPLNKVYLDVAFCDFTTAF